MIEGVKITPLKQFFDERGKVMHMMKNNSPEFKKFGEIYFSCTNPNAIKAWHLHKKMTLNYAVVSGAIKCVLYDDRPEKSNCSCFTYCDLVHNAPAPHSHKVRLFFSYL